MGNSVPNTLAVRQLLCLGRHHVHQRQAILKVELSGLARVAWFCPAQEFEARFDNFASDLLTTRSKVTDRRPSLNRQAPVT